MRRFGGGYHLPRLHDLARLYRRRGDVASARTVEAELESRLADLDCPLWNGAEALATD